MMNGLNWECKAVVQTSYLNHKPSAKNCRTATFRFAGMTKEKVIAELENSLMVTKGKERLVSYSELKEY